MQSTGHGLICCGKPPAIVRDAAGAELLQVCQICGHRAAAFSAVGNGYGQITINYTRVDFIAPTERTDDSLLKEIAALWTL